MTSGGSGEAARAGSHDFATGTATGSDGGVSAAPGTFATVNVQTETAYPPPVKATLTAN